MSSPGLAVARRVLTSTGIAAPLRQSIRLVPRGFMLRHAMPSVRMISISSSLRMPAAAKPSSKAKSTKKSSAAKKPAAKKKKTATKTKTKTKAKKAAPKTKKPKKKLTEEEKDKVEVGKLKKMSLLKGPALLPATSWVIYMASGMRPGEGDIAAKAKTLSTAFKALPESEKGRLDELAQANRIANRETVKKWVESYPVEAIYAANLARRRLAKKIGKARVYTIHDERLPSRGGSAYTLFVKERYSQVAADSSRDAFKLLSNEWKALSADEKAPYEKEAALQASTSSETFKNLREDGNAYWKEQLSKPAKTATK